MKKIQIEEERDDSILVLTPERPAGWCERRTAISMPPEVDTY